MPRRRICRKVFAGKVIGVLSAETATPIEQVSEVNLLNLLIVDGEHSVRTACLDVAQSLGFHAQQADNLGDAYHILDNTGVDVVLLDLHVPDGAGPFPTAILIHGGGFDQGSKSTNVKPLFEPLANAQFAWFSIERAAATDFPLRVGTTQSVPACGPLPGPVLEVCCSAAIGVVADVQATE